MTRDEIKSLKIGQYLYHEISDNYVLITDISWKCSQAKPNEMMDVVIQTKDFAQRCEWTITEKYWGDWHIAPANFDAVAYIEKCEKIKFCKCCGCPEEDGWELDDNGVCAFCNERKKLIKTSIRKSASVDLGEFDVLGKKGDFMELTRWANEEGFDLYTDADGKGAFYQISDGELSAIYNLAKTLGFKFDDYTEI